MRESRFLIAALIALSLSLFGCGDDDDDGLTEPPSDVGIVLGAPNGGELVQPGSTLDVTWTAFPNKNMGTVTAVDIEYIHDDAQNYITVATDVSPESPYSWTVPNENLFGVKVKVTAKDDAGNSDSDESEKVFGIVTHSTRNYVTSSVCQNCHVDQWDDLFMSGHPYKINKVVNGMPPTYPFSDVPNPPTGFSWNNVTYVIGGYGWKARFMDENGYIITDGWNGVTAQYNLPRTDLDVDEEWVPYHSGDTAPKPYTCGTCHTTGWQDFEDNGGVNQDGLEGILGTWEEAGVTCEACHGPGGMHVASKNRAQITVDQNSTLCGSCHFRDTNHGILASGGFIRHHEQYDEMISAKHSGLNCISCHDPHIGVRYGHADQGGIKVDCASCHPGEASVLNHTAGSPECIDCHMPRATKSARKVHDFEGDVRTHIFKIRTDPVSRDSMFYNDEGATFSHGYVTLDFACYTCHKDPASGMGGSASEKTLESLAEMAVGIHTASGK
ncbi:MAG: hypothetical protein HKN20_01795 [Gemmatimonadetes bacterium]|nr:hypothetical protein [Gemmatimonadota bacterium]